MNMGWVSECKEPCKGENCARLKTKIENLLDLNSDPCDDFYKFACNVAYRGESVPPVTEPLLTLDQLVENPPQGFDYVKRFYQSCTAISTKVSSSQVLRTKRKSYTLKIIGSLWVHSRWSVHRGGVS